MGTTPIAVESPTPAIAAALVRVRTLEPAYSAGVSRVLHEGSYLLWELLIAPIDASRQKLVTVVASWQQGGASETQVLEAADELTRLMLLMIERDRA